ncbi:MAG: T9SS type A sorting domain-containing protein [Flavobacteriales bacterium]|nr:T9SS type A sorting domain-containing protein [Flavobacteriales bacterium]
MRNTKTRLLLPALIALAAGTAHVQNITGYRYWFDDDVDAATTVDVTPTPELDAALSLNSAALPAGHHLATIQFRDADGHWGAPWTEHFTQKGGTVNALEYWFNDDVANAATASVTPGTAPLITTPLDATALSVGFHTVTVRSVDAAGERSVPYTVAFARNGGVITGYEYWIDEAIADRTTGNIGPAGVVDLIDNLPVPTTDGSHLFTIRFHDADGGWSVPLSSAFTFFVGIAEIPGVSNYLLFPNPVTDRLSLRLDAADARPLQIEVLDAAGRTVRQLGTWNVAGTMHNTWDASMLAGGSYVLRIGSGGRSMQIPFVKQ